MAHPSHIEHQKNPVGDCVTCLIYDNNDLRAKLAESEAECNEQARLNGMGGEREANLLGRLDRVEAERDRFKAELAEARAALSGRTVSCSQCNAMGAEVAALKAELERVEDAAGFYKSEADALKAEWAKASESLSKKVDVTTAVCLLASRVIEATFDDPGDAVRWGEAVNAWENLFETKPAQEGRS